MGTPSASSTPRINNFLKSGTNSEFRCVVIGPQDPALFEGDEGWGKLEPLSHAGECAPANRWEQDGGTATFVISLCQSRRKPPAYSFFGRFWLSISMAKQFIWSDNRRGTAIRMQSHIFTSLTLFISVKYFRAMGTPKIDPALRESLMDWSRHLKAGRTARRELSQHGKDDQR